MCGNLPLLLNLAARVIADFEEDFEEEALPALRDNLTETIGSKVNEDGESDESLSLQGDIKMFQ